MLHPRVRLAAASPGPYPGAARSATARARLGPDTQAADDRLVPNSGAKADIARGPESVQQRKWLLVVDAQGDCTKKRPLYEGQAGALTNRPVST